ncbi:MAG: hypothetical protein KL787_05965, partial [Taibaiella sp.]|nr:hypothetical protein [Taibaiella sp.]
MQRIGNVARGKYSADNKLITAIAYAQTLTAIKGASVTKDAGKQWKAIQTTGSIAKQCNSIPWVEKPHQQQCQLLETRLLFLHSTITIVLPATL